MLAAYDGSAEDYVINVSEIYSEGTRKIQIESFFTRLYQPLGIHPKFVYYPSKRGLVLVDNGTLDADAGRLHIVADDYTNLLPVPHPIAVVESGFYCLTPDGCDPNPEDVIATPKGFLSAPLLCESHQFKCQYESDENVIARMLDSGLIRSVLLTRLSAAQVLCKLSADTIYERVRPEFTLHSFHLVNRKHAKLIDGLADSIETIVASGATRELSAQWRDVNAICGKTLVTLPHEKADE